MKTTTTTTTPTTTPHGFSEGDKVAITTSKKNGLLKVLMCFFFRLRMARTESKEYTATNVTKNSFDF